jgi:hypothetical protein
MVFSKELWENLLENSYLRRSIEDGSFYGGSQHRDADEVTFGEVACRVTKFWIGENNLVLGDVDILNTPNGVIVYTLAKISRVGISSRGFGELVDRPDGLKEVDPDQYTHVCWDMVTFPAVPDASMTLVEGDTLPSKELQSMSADLRSLIREAYDRSPENKPLQRLFLASGGVQKTFSGISRADLQTALIAHSLRKKSYSGLHSGKRSSIVSMAERLLSAVKGPLFVWLLGFSKDVLKYFPDGKYGYSEEDMAWQIMDGKGNLLVSVGFLEATGEFIYIHYLEGYMKSGRTKSVKDLKNLLQLVRRI